MFKIFGRIEFEFLGTEMNSREFLLFITILCLRPHLPWLDTFGVRVILESHQTSGRSDYEKRDTHVKAHEAAKSKSETNAHPSNLPAEPKLTILYSNVQIEFFNHTLSNNKVGTDVWNAVDVPEFGAVLHTDFTVNVTHCGRSLAVCFRLIFQSLLEISIPFGYSSIWWDLVEL